jgi:hypothetical protein
MKIQIKKTFCVVAVSAVLSGCATANNGPFFSGKYAEKRQKQTRIFETNDEKMVLTAVIAVLQDFGFTIEEIDGELGVVKAVEKLDAKRADQTVGAVSAGIGVAAAISLPSLYLFPITFAIEAPIWIAYFHSKTDSEQLFELTAHVKHVRDRRTTVRVNFRRIIWDRTDKLKTRENIKDPEIYKMFFAALSKSLFREQEIQES